MKNLTLDARAKINLSIDVLRKRTDGYHDVQMIMQSIELCDNVDVSKVCSGISVDCDNSMVPSDYTNTAYRAAILMRDKFGIKDGIRVKIKKTIPIAAGLAGGSTDAAAVLKAVNTLFDLGQDKSQLMELGFQIGADVPYCICGGTVLAEGIGQELTQLKSNPTIDTLLVKPNFGVSTAWVYSNYNNDLIKERPNINLLLDAIDKSDVAEMAANMINVLETVTLKEYPQVGEIKLNLFRLGAMGSLMSGSGPTVFGFFKDYDNAKAAMEEIKRPDLDVYITKT